MKRLLLFFLLVTTSIYAQTGIGTSIPDASAKLDVYSTNKGFLPPRVTLTSTTDASTIASPAEGLLVYNLGSVGLQAGYYFWNGANWATIATATSAGNGVTASDMVKIYDGVANAATINANGATFSVTTSGKYSFDISTSATCNNCMVTLNFQVRDGANSNAVIGSDYQTSYNNNVHAEYNGKVEVNLLAGRSYNVLVTASSGGIYNSDYTRVYMKQVSGNLPVTGQSVDYIQASLSANQTLSAAGNVIFNTSSGAGITLTSGGFELKANKTYKLEAAMGGSSSGYAYYTWVDNLNAKLPGASIGVTMQAGDVHTDAPQDKAVVFYTPTVNTTVYLRVLNVSGSVTAYAPPAANNFSSTWATIQQVGSSAIVNPWVLTGNDVYNTTGKIGIGTNAPTQALDVIGNVKASGSIIGAAAGSTIKTTILSSSELASGSSTLINSTTATTIATSSYTPISNSSYIIIEYNTSYRMGGYGPDTFESQIAVGGTLISKGLQDFTGSSSGGGGTRSSVLFPLVARYTNSSTTPISITVKANRNSADDSITVYNDTSTWMKITEIAR